MFRFFFQRLFFQFILWIIIVIHSLYFRHARTCREKFICWKKSGTKSSCQEGITGTSSKILKSFPSNQQIESSSDEFERKGRGDFETLLDFLGCPRNLSLTTTTSKSAQEKVLKNDNSPTHSPLRGTTSQPSNAPKPKCQFHFPKRPFCHPWDSAQVSSYSP